MPPMLPSETGHPLDAPWGPTAHEQQLLSDWIANGMPEGSRSAMEETPPTDGSSRPPIPNRPADLELVAPEWTVPPETLEEHRCFVLPGSLAQNTLVRAIRWLPGNASIVHRMNLFEVRGRASQRLETVAGETMSYPCFSGVAVDRAWSDSLESPDFDVQQVGAWTPGAPSRSLPGDAVIPLRAGSRFVLQVHYRKHRRVSTQPDRSGVAMFFESRGTEGYWLPLAVPTFTVMPGARPDTSAARASTSSNLLAASYVHAVYPVMHARGRSLVLRGDDASGRSRPWFELPLWSFNWAREEYFAQAIHGPSSVTLTCVWDNTPAGQPSVDGVQVAPRLLTPGETIDDERCEVLLFVTRTPISTRTR